MAPWTSTPSSPGLDGALGGTAEVPDDVADLGGGQRVRHRVGPPAGARARHAVDGDRAGGDDAAAAVGVGVGDPPAVHHLQHDPAAAVVHRLGDAAPAGHLLVGDDAGPADEGLRLVVGVGALGHEETRAGALCAVLDDQVAGDAGRARAT